MTDVLIVVHHERSEARRIAAEATSWLHEHGHRARLSTPDAERLDRVDLADDDDPSLPDLVLALGGDGTMLRAVAAVDGAGVPILGVNLGVLGYLTEVELHAWEASLSAALLPAEEGGWHLDERLMLDVWARDASGAERGRWRALNEAVVEKREAGGTVRLEASIDGALFTSYAADGLIVATPTGSTAYSLSARGPIVSPRHRALLLTPVSPHMLFDRTLVLDPSEDVEIGVMGHAGANLVVDGRVVLSLDRGGTVACRPSGAVARFVRFGDRKYHQILKEKFGLVDR